MVLENRLLTVDVNSVPYFPDSEVIVSSSDESLHQPLTLDIASPAISCSDGEERTVAESTKAHGFGKCLSHKHTKLNFLSSV